MLGGLDDDDRGTRCAVRAWISQPKNVKEKQADSNKVQHVGRKSVRRIVVKVATQMPSRGLGTERLENPGVQPIDQQNHGCH